MSVAQAGRDLGVHENVLRQWVKEFGSDPVQAFPGHIACDAASRSEIVVPLLKDGRLLGVLDLDSPFPGRFDAADQAGLERIAAILAASSHG